MMLETLIGNEPTKDALAAAVQNGRLAHCLLLCGEFGCGTGYAARCLAADFLAPQGGAAAAAVMQRRSPDVLLVEGEGASGGIKIDRVRAVRSEVFNTSLSSERRVVIVRKAENFNPQSANAFLKTLEEPPENVLFILTASSAATVLPTIRSRCCIYTLATPGVQACTAYLQKKYPRADNVERLATIFDGKIGAVEEILSSRANYNILVDADALLQSIDIRDAYGAVVLLAKYEKEKAKAVQLLRYLYALAATTLAENIRAVATLQTARAAMSQLADNNGSVKLVLTNFAAQACA